MTCGMLARLLMPQAVAAELSVPSAGAIEPGVKRAVGQNFVRYLGGPVGRSLFAAARIKP